MLMIELKREDPLEPLGFTVAGYRTADSRYQFNIFVIFCNLFLSCAMFPFICAVGVEPLTLIRVSTVGFCMFHKEWLRWWQIKRF